MEPDNNAVVAEHNFAQATLLVVEDNPDIWLIVSLMLKKHLPEVSVKHVVNAHQALDYLDQNISDQGLLPKLILHNLYLPLLIDGLDSLEAIRTKLLGCHCQQIPILVMSSSTDPEDIRRAYSSGASGFYLKPLTAAEWSTYFERLRTFWWETIMLPLA